jgi:hypothetical protein
MTFYCKIDLYFAVLHYSKLVNLSIAVKSRSRSRVDLAVANEPFIKHTGINYLTKQLKNKISTYSFFSGLFNFIGDKENKTRLILAPTWSKLSTCRLILLPTLIPQSGVGTTWFNHVVIKIRHLFLRPAVCLLSTLLETGADANAAGTNSLTCLPKHGGARDQLSNDWPRQTMLSFRDRTPRWAHWPLGHRAPKIKSEL